MTPNLGTKWFRNQGTQTRIQGFAHYHLSQNGPVGSSRLKLQNDTEHEIYGFWGPISCISHVYPFLEV